MLVHPSGIDLSSRALQHLSGLLAGHRRRIGSRWRRPTRGRQALPVLARLRCGDTYARLAAGFRVGIATVYRYIREAVDLLAARAPMLEQAMTAVRNKAYVILDGTVPPIDRIAADQPYYSGKKKHHGMNVQVLADPAGRLIRASDALPGAVHDPTAARTHGIPAALAADDIKCRADRRIRAQVTRPAILAPARPASARPTAASVERSRSVHRLYLRVGPGICSTKVRRPQETSRQKNLRTRRQRTTPRPALGTSAGNRRYELVSGSNRSRNPGTRLGPPRYKPRYVPSRRSRPPTAPLRLRPTGTTAPPVGALHLPRRRLSATRAPSLIIFRQLPGGCRARQPSLTVRASQKLSQNHFSSTFTSRLIDK
ncbi:transposase family protein [Streptomyces brevispora]|uniref:transposase family protein n=1 Tax=Streptomyces brevispora TaxID=887462 RepID=UPI003F4D59AC